MRKTSFYSVQKVSLAIYLFSLAFGIYFMATETKVTSIDKTDIASIIFIDEDTGDGNQSSNPKKKFGSKWVGEEDDDDSAKDFLCDLLSNPESILGAPLSTVVGYTSNPRTVNTPPPWC